MSSTARRPSFSFRTFTTACFVIYIVSIVVSGFAYPLGYSGRVWLFERGWFMFNRDPGWLSQMRVYGQRADGRLLRVDMRRWFRYQAAFESLRYNEIYRTPEAVAALADYVCRRSNEKPPSGQRLCAVTIVDVSWPLVRGRHRYLAEVSDHERRYDPLLKNHSCGTAAP